MDPFVTIGLVVQAVGLYQQFQSSRDQSKEASLDQFRDWLRRQEHSKVIGLLNENTELCKAIHLELGQCMEKIEHLEKSLAMAICDEFTLLARVAGIEQPFSDQARSILGQMVELDIKEFHTCRTSGGLSCSLDMIGNEFFEEDLSYLVECGCLLVRSQSSDFCIYVRTRKGVALGKKMAG